MFTAQTFVGLIPEFVAFFFLVATLMVGVFTERATGLVAGIAAFGAVAIFGSTVVLLLAGFDGSFFGDGFVVDGFALYFKLIVSGSAFFAILAAARWAERTGDMPEYLTLILSVSLGSMLLVSMRDLFGIFVALELATIPSYALVAFDRRRRESSEGGMKYLITGVIASSILLYGIVLIYGVSGSAALPAVAETFTGQLSPVALLGLVLLLSGFAFKVSAAPFHFWTPDAYPGRADECCGVPLRGPEGRDVRGAVADSGRGYAGRLGDVDGGHGVPFYTYDVRRQSLRAAPAERAPDAGLQLRGAFGGTSLRLSRLCRAGGRSGLSRRS